MALNGNSDTINGYNSVIANGLDADARHVKSVIPPLGVVMAWLKSFTGIPALPDGWVECNGQVLSDIDSPFNGQTIPDLNGSSGTNRFLRGSTTSGTTGGSEEHTHNVTIPNGTKGNSGYAEFAGAPGTRTTTSVSTLPSYYEVVWIMRVK